MLVGTSETSVHITGLACPHWQACYLTPDHYSDVIEERSISGLCGYPLCSNPLKDVPAQKYHISVQQKQIFDITERKVCMYICTTTHWSRLEWKWCGLGGT